MIGCCFDSTTLSCLWVKISITEESSLGKKEGGRSCASETRVGIVGFLEVGEMTKGVGEEED